MGKIKFSKKEKGIKINNLPEFNCGVQTGRYINDLHGTWYEVERKDKSKFWMIGENKKEPK